MTLRKFEEAYKEAVSELPEYHMDVERVLDEQRHAEFTDRGVKNRRGSKAWLRTAAVAASLFILCGVGTVTAMNYRKGIITVVDTGYSITSQKVAEVGRLDVEQDKLEAEEKEEIYQEYIQTITSEAAKKEVPAGISSETDVATASAYDEDVLEVLEAQITEPVQYSSIEAFQANEDIIVALPVMELLGVFEEENIMVMEEGAYVSLMFYSEEKSFGLTQQDTRSFEQYASSTTYVGESVNERSLMNAQGLSYVIFDTMEEGVVVSTHAVISVNGRDLCLDFFGYEEKVIENVLKQLDLSIYFQD